MLFCLLQKQFVKNTWFNKNIITDTYIHTLKIKTFGNHSNTKITNTFTRTKRVDVSCLNYY